MGVGTRISQRLQAMGRSAEMEAADVLAYQACESLPSHEREGQIFWKLRLRLIRSHLVFAFSQSRLRTCIVVVLSVLFWLGLFGLFYEGFRFVVSQVDQAGAPYHAQTMRFVFSLFFLSLQVMLVFSTGIILYGSLYASPEASFLMTLPARDERLVAHRFQEALLFSSWGFFLLASPMLLAYGLVVNAPWYYFAFFPFLMLAFAYIPCALGSIVCLLLIYRLPGLRKAIVALTALVVIVAAYQSIWSSLNVSDVELLGNAWFKETYHRFRFSREEWLPSTWLSNALIDAARRGVEGDPRDLPWLKSGQYLVVLASNALILHVLLAAVGKRTFRSGYWALSARQARVPHASATWFDCQVERILFLFPRPMRLLIVKDLRLFRRDPVQWSQFLIFFGLLVLYFANIDRFRQHRNDANVLMWVNFVSFLNLAVVGLILSTFTTRFIYPLISLEGRRFWILSRLPIKRDAILWGKFFFAAGGSWLPSAFLVAMSDVMLDVSILIVAVHQFICLLLCLGLAGMAVGLGAVMPNFRESSPSKIAAGFGGTLNLVLSALYILVVVLLTALPCHFYLFADRANLSSDWLQPSYLKLWLATGMLGAVVIAAAVTIIPLRHGLRAFRRIEV